MTRTHEIKLDGYGAHTTLADDRPVMLLGTAESYGIEILHIAPGKDWAELTITATFNAADGTSTDMLMGTDGNIAVPTEATAKSGSGRIVFTGVSDGIQRISCDLDYFVVAHSAINGTQSGGVAPSWFEQAARRFMPLGGTTGQVLSKKTDADFDAEWQDSKGGAGGITPTIGDNGNWFLGETDTGKPSRGEKGDKGDKGDTGEKGEKGDTGAKGDTGEKGEKGDAFSYADFTPEQLAALKGEKGDKGDKGDTGVQGIQGEKGEKGDTGATGATGANGKSAYSYAQDGGYTGTEAEFAAKLAAEGLDKALYVVNATADFDTMALSVDKTFEEIKQVYDEGKCNIVLSLMGMTVTPLIALHPGSCIFAGVSTEHGDIAEVRVDTIIITKDNVVQLYSDNLATLADKLPNPYPLTFTGAVNATYDGSSAKTIEIPSGGGSAHEVIIASSTAGSTKKFKITVDDSGTISATEVV